MAIFKCKMCGGELEINENQTVATCEYCGTQQTLPKLDDDRRANLYDRANHFRRNNDFDKAEGIYERILTEDNSDAEVYWSLVLCHYGIEYVEDPATHKRVPTVNRAQYTSIFDDENYKSALQYADSYQRGIYEAEAKTINEIQKGILAISQQEEPFDVFICYKETDNNGRRTPDSVLANDLYHQLTQEGFKVFFSRITLEDKLGSAYEPYIFAALNSAKVMVVLGTKPEYFNAVWVKNEWSRYLALIRQGQKKMLIPAYRDMDPYDLPEKFSHLQAQDMSKLGFMQDLIRGIKKIAQTDEPKPNVVKEAVATDETTSTAPLLKRAFMFLEDGDWKSADEYCERVLDIDPENARAYLGKLMAELRVRKQEQLREQTKSFADNKNYQKALRFADDALRTEIVSHVEHIENTRMYNIYSRAKSGMAAAQTERAYLEAAELFASIRTYQDSAELEAKCCEAADEIRKDAIYANAEAKMSGTIARYEEALALFTSISGWKSADANIALCKKKIEELKEADQKKKNAHKALIQKQAQRENRIFSIAGESNYTIGLKSDGTVVAEGDNTSGQCNVSEWKDIMSICCINDCTIGLKADGTVVATGWNEYGQCNVSDWTDIVSIYLGPDRALGLKSDGTVVAAGDNEYGQCNMSDWTNIVSVCCINEWTIGLKKDGTVIATGDNKHGECNVSDWSDIVSICDSDHCTIGLKSNGTVVMTGDNKDKDIDVSGWTDIVAINSGIFNVYGLKSDGTVVATGWNPHGQCNVSDWTDIVSIVGDTSHTIGLRADGTVVAVGDNTFGQCNVSDWTDIVFVYCSGYHTVGLKSDGTVVATGNDKKEQDSVSDWTDIMIPEALISKMEQAYEIAKERKQRKCTATVSKLRQEQSELQTELANLKGLFSGKRRREIEARLAEIKREIERNMG